MRKKHIKLNVFFTILSKLVVLILGFVSRKLIITLITVEYLGLNSLYANLLDLLNLAELGLGVAIQIRLYGPLVDKDKNKITYLLNFAKKLYTTIGLIVLAFGIATSFALRFIIKDNPFDFKYVQTAYLISVIGISLSYFCADKRLFFESNERYFYITLFDMISRTVLIALGLTILYFTREYLFYCMFIALQSFITNTALYILFKIRYSSYVTKTKEKQDYPEEKEKIIENMKDVVPMKLGAFIFSSTDSIVISSFLGLTFVALYTNYNLLFISMLSISTLISTALVSTFGKIEKENPNRENLFNKFNIYSNLQFMFSSFTTVCMLLLINKFIYIWLGDGFYLDDVCVILLSADYFIHSLFQPLSTVYTSTGKFKQDKICMIISASMNIIISIVLVNFIGLPGIIIGTLCANIFTYINRTIVMNKLYFNRSNKEIIFKPIIQILIICIEIVVCYLVISLINISNKYLDFVVCGLICTLLTNIINLILFKYYGYFSLLRRKSNETKKETSK